MQKEWSSHWVSSTQVRKQRKYRVKAPLHIARHFLSALLSKELRKKYKHRNVPLRKGDTVKILRGQFKGKTGKVERVSLVHRKAYVENIHTIKKDGNRIAYALEASKLMITELNLEDKKRKEILERI